MLRPLFVSAITAYFLGCGGNVVVDHGSGAGGKGTGGGGVTEGATTGTVIGTSSADVGVTSASASVGTGTTCPDKVYEDGPCQVEGLSCPMNLACCGGSAVCKGGAWHFTGPLCNMPCIPCGPDDGFACQTSALCVSEQTDIGNPTYHCAANPCPPGAEGCDCASQLCDGLTCEGVKNLTVVCDCPNC